MKKAIALLLSFFSVVVLGLGYQNSTVSAATYTIPESEWVEDSLTNEGQLIPAEEQEYFDSLPDAEEPGISTFGLPSLFTKHLLVMGHGAGDPGAGGNGTNEANFTRNELLPYLQKYARQLKYSTIDFYDTSKNMYAESKKSQGAWTVSTNYDSVTEFHLDGSTNTSKRGGHVIAYKENNTATNLALAQIISQYVGLNSSYSGGMSYRTDLYNMRILQSRGIPYRLVEMGFISNAADLAKLRGNLDAFAKALVETISGEKITSQAQGSSMDQFNASAATISGAGWFTNSRENGTGYQFIFFLDENGKELARVQASQFSRPDVAAAFPSISNAVNSGFNFSFSTPSNLWGRKVYLMGRKAASSNGENSIYDVHFTEEYTIPTPETKGTLESFTQNGNSISAKGWFFNTSDASSNTRHLFLLDKNGKELYRTQLNSVERTDVAASYPSLATSLTSGFEVTFTVPESLRGQTVQVMVRSASDTLGNATNFQTTLRSSQSIANFTNAGHIDIMDVTSTSLSVTGWHYSEKAGSTDNHQLALIDETNGEVLQTVLTTNIQRSDVSNIYGENAINSGYKADFKLDSSYTGKILSVRSSYLQENTTNEIASIKFSNTVVVPRSDAGQTVYRLYNPNSGEHLYTSNASEVLDLVKLGWNSEGIAWVGATSGNKVYRLYNKNNGDHFFTMDAKESNDLVKLGWTFEEIGFYSDINQGQKIYRLFNPNEKTYTHHFTTSQSEMETMRKAGWRYEGIGWYALS